MELELGLKFTRAADEFTSDFRITKGRAGTLFLSRETDTMFVLTAHLKGYKRGNIKIDINKDGSLIGISGEKQIKETVMVGWKLYKKDAEVTGFKKVFRIPDGVILDEIEALFNDDESILTITMPKKVKGIRGTAIEEVKEEHQLVKEGYGNLQVADDQSSDKGEKLKEKIEDRVDESRDGEAGVDEIKERIETKEDKENDVVEKEEIEGPSFVECGGEEGVENRREANEIEKIIESKEDQEVDKEERSEKEGASVVETSVESRREIENEKVEDKRYKMCLPIVAGSTLLLSFVVFVIQIIRSKNRNSTRRD
ncbi:hypothetical protein ACS0TY_036650 [Phlomoides rotata]